MHVFCSVGGGEGGERAVLWMSLFITTGSACFGTLEIKEPLGMGIWNRIKIKELPVLYISKTLREPTTGFHERISLFLEVDLKLNLDIKQFKNMGSSSLGKLKQVELFWKSWQGTRELNFRSKLINLFICCRALYLVCYASPILIEIGVNIHTYKHHAVLKNVWHVVQWNSMAWFWNWVQELVLQFWTKKKVANNICVCAAIYTYPWAYPANTLTCPTLHLTRTEALIAYWDGALPN